MKRPEALRLDCRFLPHLIWNRGPKTAMSDAPSSRPAARTSLLGMTKDQELALGEQAAARMAQEFGGLDPSPELQAFIDGYE